MQQDKIQVEQDKIPMEQKDLINLSSGIQLEEKGKKIYRDNEHFRRLANVMEHPEFREFFQLYMQDWESTKVIVMFMKMYEALEKHSKIELTPYQKISIIKDVIDDSEMRHKVCQGITEWSRLDGARITPS